MGRTALVTGASGFMAHQLIPVLLEDGWEVRATARKPRPDWLPDEVSYEPADLAGDAPLAPLCQGADALFHLAGATSSLSSAEEMHRSNVIGTTRIAAAAREAGTGRFVHIGSTSIYGEEVPLPQPVLETVEPHPSRGYGKAKWGAEEALWAEVAKGLPAVALRPVSMFGPGAFKLLASAILDVAIEQAAGEPAFAVESTPIELRLVHVADVVGAAVHLAQAPGAAGRPYNVVAAWYPSALELAGILTEQFGMRLEACEPSGSCGLPLGKRRATWESMVAAGMRPSILFTEERLRFLKKQNRNNRLSTEALTGTGYRFAYGDEPGVLTGIADTIAWYRGQRWIS
ncbi:MAG TPA: NAD(P)-dependent oxidoreductase [Actinomycetota bacterium]|nr:NAD(P)-dependent oxidoreductase [Actinomycetota bacterium]